MMVDFAIPTAGMGPPPISRGPVPLPHGGGPPPHQPGGPRHPFPQGRGATQEGPQPAGGWPLQHGGTFPLVFDRAQQHPPMPDQGQGGGGSFSHNGISIYPTRKV